MGKQRKQRKNKFAKSILSGITQFFIIVGLVLLIKSFIFDIWMVSGHSMEPNLKDGQVILIEKWSSLFSGKNKGIHFYDKVVIDNVNFPGLKAPINIVKRVIGLPGDKIDIISGEVYRNGTKLKEPLIKEKIYQINQSYKVGKDQIFVMGDNRNNSEDSRDIGPLPISKVEGVVIQNFYANWFVTASHYLKSFFFIKEYIK